MVGGRGAYLELEDGRRILDMSSLAECSNLGHQHPAVVAAIREQAQQLCFVTSAWGAKPRAELAEALLAKSGFDGGRVFFTLAGADANENAVKFARQAGGKPHGHIVTRDRSYHGASYACMALSGDARTRSQVDPEAFGVLQVPPPYAYRCPFGSDNPATCGERAVAAVAETIDRHDAATVAAVLMEPNAGTNGIVAPDSYWPGLREATRGARCLVDRRRGDERLRPLRRVVRLAALRRGRQARPDDPGEGPHRRPSAAGCGGAVGRGRRTPAAPDALHRPDLLRPSAGLRRRAGGAACLRGRELDRALAHPGRLDVSPSCRRCRRAMR